MTQQQALEKMWADFRLRGFAESTSKNYTRSVRAFFAFCDRPVDELDVTDARRFLLHLIDEKKLAPRTINTYSAAISFFFAVSLNRYINKNQIPTMKLPRTLPDVLTKEETGRLIAVCENLKHKALLLLAYGSGLRVGEIVTLRPRDIGSKEMRVFVKGGKNKRDHYTVLSQTTLDALRDYWRAYRPNSPEGWLFPGMRNIGHITRAAIALAFDNCRDKANITKEVSPHSLRHAFATHMLEDGVELLKIKEMLGHYRINSTLIYLHLANAAKGVTSPADTMPVVSND